MPRFSLTMRTKGSRLATAAVGFPQVFFGHAGFHNDMGSCQHAAHQVHRGHGQVHIFQAQLLDDFGGVAVPVGGEGADHVGSFRVVRAGLPSAPPSDEPTLISTITGLVQIHQPGFDQRQQGQVAAGGIAADAADVTGAPSIRSRCISGRP